MCEARYADVRIRVEKYGREGRAEGIAVFASGARLALSGVSSGTMRCTSADSPWCRKMALFLTSSREKSHSVFPPGGVSPFTTGATNRGHNLSHMERKSGMDPAVGPTNESYTVETKYGYTRADVSSGKPSKAGASELRIIWMASLRV